MKKRNFSYQRIIVWGLLLILSLFTWVISVSIASITVNGLFRKEVMILSKLNKHIAEGELYLIAAYVLFLAYVIILFLLDKEGSKALLIDLSLKVIFILFVVLIFVNIAFLVKYPWQVDKLVWFGSNNYDYEIRRNMLFVFTPLLGVNIVTTIFLVLKYKQEKLLAKESMIRLIIAVLALVIVYTMIIAFVPVFEDQTVVREWMRG